MLLQYRPPNLPVAGTVKLYLNLHTIVIQFESALSKGGAMARRDTILQVRMDQTVLGELQVRAEELGFDSVPALVRFWVKAEIDGQSLGAGREGRRAGGPHEQVLRYVELILMLNPATPRSAEAALDYLMRQMRRANFRKFFRDFPGGETSDRIFET